jgi:hypothetical protein
MLADKLYLRERKDALIENALQPNNTCLRLLFDIHTHLYADKGLGALMGDPWDKLVSASHGGKNSV